VKRIEHSCHCESDDIERILMQLHIAVVCSDLPMVTEVLLEWRVVGCPVWNCVYVFRCSEVILCNGGNVHERPQVADGGTASYMDGSCEYIE